MSLPTAEQQIEFLQHIQRLFDEGEFQATYKFALLLTLAELAVEHGDDSGAEISFPMPLVSEKFAEFYWRQAAPYHSGLPGTEPRVLSQNQGVQAAVVNYLTEIHRQSGGLYSRARMHPDWKQVLSRISAVIRNMPLRYLQIIGGVQVTFLYDYPAPPGAITLKPGVAFNLRRYQALIQQFARAGWIDHVRGNNRNAPMLGQADDLEGFMFGSQRASLASVAQILGEVQSDRCFYCQERLRGSADVDHFVPWARYPRDTAHNFVLAHRSCNNDKRALLAAKPHLERWLEQTDRRGAEVGERLSALGFIANSHCSKLVAHWAYGQTADVNGQVWSGRGVVIPISADYLDLFGRAD